MKIKVTAVSPRVIKLPTGYQYNLHAFIYNLIDKHSADWLHDNGFVFEKRRFKLFNFSEILGRAKYDRAAKVFTFKESISFYITSPVDWILEQIAKNCVTKDKLVLGQNEIIITAIEVFKSVSIVSDKVRVNCLTPIEVHSTLTKGDGSKKTYYYSPDEKEFSELINENLRKKWTALFKKDCPYNLRITPVNIRFNRERKRSFKGTVIKGWTGHFYLEGDRELMQFAFDAGLGSRNSAGWGMIELVEKREKTS
jgi:CRISPR-associated endoribonuclease Cas6